MMNELTRQAVLCCSCSKPIEQPDMEYAIDPAAHPGVLAPIHPSCYASATAVEPDLPWTDPISGEVDFDEMAGDLGVYDGTDDWDDLEE